MGIDRFDRDLVILLGLIAVATLGAAWVLSHDVLRWGDVVSVYLQIGFLGGAVGITAVIVTCTLKARLASTSLLAGVKRGLSNLQIWVWLAVPTVIAPIFIAGFTIIKTLIGINLGFTWDAYFADLDQSIFGTDPWHFTHAVFGTTFATRFLELWYVGWGAVLAFAPPIVIVMARREHAAKFMLGMFLTWAIAGLFLAALFASAGPCFASQFDPALGQRFAPLKQQLTELLEQDDAIRLTQHYLAKHWNTKIAVKGGGISAFPSVHVGVAVLYCIAAWRTPLWRYASLFFASMIWVGSIHFGYHYAIDGLASAGVALASWLIANRTVDLIANRHQRAIALA